MSPMHVTLKAGVMSMEFGSVSGSQGEFLKIEVVQGENNPLICFIVWAVEEEFRESGSIIGYRSMYQKNFE